MKLVAGAKSSALNKLTSRVVISAVSTALAVLAACHGHNADGEIDASNPIVSNAQPPLGMEDFFRYVPKPVPARVRLGRWLFFDSRLSADGTVSCATCHRPPYAFADIVSTSPGVGAQRGQRKTPSIINLASRTVLPGIPNVGPTFFWDGRATSLEAQVLMPIENPTEMGLEHPAMISRLMTITSYRRYFKESFGSDDITKERVATAIADYVRTRVSGNSPFDRWQFGRNPKAMTADAQLGYDVFSFQGRCATCHVGLDFSDSYFHNLGVGWNEATQRFRDEGRMVVTGLPEDTGRFKTPRLRDVDKHPPYMHDGSIQSLREVVEFYNRGGIANPWRSARLDRPLNLSPKEIGGLVAFLQALSGEGYADPGPKLFPK